MDKDEKNGIDKTVGRCYCNNKEIIPLYGITNDVQGTTHLHRDSYGQQPKRKGSDGDEKREEKTADDGMGLCGGDDGEQCAGSRRTNDEGKGSRGVGATRIRKRGMGRHCRTLGRRDDTGVGKSRTRSRVSRWDVSAG